MSRDKYAKMQKDLYEAEASTWSLDNKDPVVGSFDLHNKWSDYDDFLFRYQDTTNKIALDFGCGPGRNIVKFAPLFKQIDGVDISQINLDKAKVWFEANNFNKECNLFMNNGIDISCCESEHYDVVFSTIAMQHICVYDTRFSLLSDFYRVLKPGGSLCIQMGYGSSPHKRTVHYNDNYFEAAGTNGFCDVRIDTPDQIQNDLEKIGFKNFSFDIRPVGPGDGHANWIFFRANK